MTDDDKRDLELEQTVPGTPEQVWEALTTSDGLQRWFPLDARVEPGEGGRVWLSWGPGCEGEAPIHIWEPASRFGWTESHGEDENGRPIRIAVDFHIEGRDGSTVVRMVQSGFSASSEWDEMFDALVDGWRYFLFNLAFHFEVHEGGDRTLVWRRQPTDMPRDRLWQELVDAGLVAGSAIRLGSAHEARAVSDREGHHYAAVLPGLNDSIWFVELEGRHVGFWLSVYDETGMDVGALQSALEEAARATCGD